MKLREKYEPRNTRNARKSSFVEEQRGRAVPIAAFEVCQIELVNEWNPFCVFCVFRG